MKSQGMVRVAGTTYRIAKVGAHHYEVTRIIDEARAGYLLLGPAHEFISGALSADELREIARVAIRSAKVSCRRVSRDEASPSSPLNAGLMARPASPAYEQSRLARVLLPERSPA